MKTLILSNYLQAERLPGIVYSKWGVNHPSVADFQCVVLDMKLNINVNESPPVVSYEGYSFYELSEDVIRLLGAGGVVICLNYYTFVNQAKSLSGTPLLNARHQKKLTEYSYEYKWLGQEETSYDWLDLGFLQCTQLDRTNIRTGQQIRIISSLGVVKSYFIYVSEYHKVIKGIRRNNGDQRGILRWIYKEKPDYSQAAYTDDDVDTLAVTGVTDEPIAIAIKYRGLPGMIVLLPTYELPNFDDPGRDETIRMISGRLRSLGEYYYEENRRKLGIQLESPPWLLDYRVKQAKVADKELEDMEKTKAELITKRDKYDRMLTLISGSGEVLEKAVRELFGKDWFGFDVEETEKGHPIDLFVKSDKTGQTLAVQVTGVANNFTQKDKHFGAIMQYLPEHEEKNVDSRNERIVLVLNTYRDVPLKDRTDTDDISTHVERLAKRNGICIIRTSGLFKLWSILTEKPEEFNADDIFGQLFSCEGILKPD